jgi:hypothetical protein
MENSNTMLYPSTVEAATGSQSLEQLASMLADEIPFDIDAHLLQKMEARIDAELGADAHNLDTFGESSGWSFQENLAANLINNDSWQKVGGDSLVNVECLPVPPPPPLEPTVRVTNLPNHLTSRPMMEAILEQANLDALVCDFIAKPGAQRGEVVLTMSSSDAATKCAQHFEGRRWDASGYTVRATVISHGVPPVHSESAFQFSVDVPEFVPFFDVSSHRQMPKTALSACGSDVSTCDDVSSFDGFGEQWHL